MNNLLKSYMTKKDIKRNKDTFLFNFAEGKSADNLNKVCYVYRTMIIPSTEWKKASSLNPFFFISFDSSTNDKNTEKIW